MTDDGWADMLGVAGVFAVPGIVFLVMFFALFRRRSPGPFRPPPGRDPRRPPH